MSIIPSSNLSNAELRALGNNVVRPRKSRSQFARRHRQQMMVSAVNRSLAVVGEQIDRLRRLPTLA